eukprot:TRINITY_DN3750_c0_g1_i1.p1 TRINITY_DN3750_c0_g1~~TRINITY_DN3750_c0_g1_i1.p1  ORF type:complete len:340 (-),score=38.99 TRINITY_DN3750_c0_g1_i1:123-1142(-)
MKKRENKLSKSESSRKPRRQTWTQDEDDMLLQIVNEYGKERWNLLSQELNKRLAGCHKNGKQCRERFRNYLDPSLTKEEWSKNERVLFALMHKHFGNSWGKIAKYYKGRSDISLKNLFYSQIRKSIKCLKHGTITKSMAKKPQKVYFLYYILDIIRSKYLPSLDSSSSSFEFEKSEKIILGIIKDKSISHESVEKYQQRLLAEFVKSKGKSIINILTEDLELEDRKVEELDKIIKQNTIFPLSKYITIVLKQSKSATEPEVKLTPANQTPQPIYPIQSQIQNPENYQSLPYFCPYQLMQMLKDSPAMNSFHYLPSLQSPFPPMKELPPLSCFLFNGKPH